MKEQIIPAGEGRDYDWGSDHIYVKTTADMTEGRVTIVEDTLKPGFDLARHYHKKMIEIFYILDGEVAFAFDDTPEPVIALPGMTINVPPYVWHHVTSKKGAKLITVFSPGGFDKYLSEMEPMTAAQFADKDFMTALSEKYDSWMR
jgi:quercetin dioxygenase-like cupin family protein